ncbi:MAG: hypothetical protein HDT32_03575 [Clostridiales bacterium]|nr:hypothetical protein [Clostridiales bacterium]
MEISWRFPPLSGGSKQGYTNNDIEGFKGEELIDNLAREICQNSLDARDDKAEGPVKVVFELKTVPTEKYDVFLGYKKCLERCREFWSVGGDIDAKLGSFLTEAENTLRKDKVNVLVASDYNTKGLLGNHNLNNINTPWEALTGADGISVKSDDNSGGSFGIGKNAPFACSALSMVFYNTYDVNKNKAFVGVGRVATLLNDEGKPTQRIGRYQKNDDEKEEWLPIYEEDDNNFRDLFVRKEHGTDVIIVGFNETDNWQDNVAKAVIKNFFVAIREKRLVVEIKNENQNKKCIDDTSVAEFIEEYSKNDRHLEITRQLFSTFSTPDDQKSIEILGEEDAVEIYVKAESSFARTIANFRSNGMLVGQGSKRMFQHYAAIMIVRGEKLGKLLRECEPPRHNRWDYKLIKGEANKSKRNDAKKALDDLYEELWRILKAQYESPAGDTTDAPGMSAYLADTEDGALPEDSNGKDILKVKIKIGKPKIKKNTIMSTDVPGREDEGKEVSHNGGNQGSNMGPIPDVIPGPNPGPGPGPLPGPNPGQSPDPIVQTGTKPTQKGVVEGNGNRTIPIKELSKRRAFPVQSNIGLYKAVIFPAKDYKRLFVECVVVGEDGEKETLNINKFSYQGKPVNCNGKKAGPMIIEKDNPAEFMIIFEKKEKMGVKLILSEGV